MINAYFAEVQVLSQNDGNDLKPRDNKPKDTEYISTPTLVTLTALDICGGRDLLMLLLVDESIAW